MVDVSTNVGGKRQRTIKSFGAGTKARAAAEAYRDEVAPQAKAGRFWELQTATFGDLWAKFEATELIGPTLAPGTITDYKACARMYLLPHLGHRLLADLDARVLIELKARLLTEPGAKSGVPAAAASRSLRARRPRSSPSSARCSATASESDS